MVSIRISVSVPEAKFVGKKWLDEIAMKQRQQVVPKLKHLFEQTVFGWSRKPNFGWVQTRTGDEISVMMYPEGAAADTWALVSSGAPGHVIVPKRSGGFLRFKPGYRAATTPGKLQSRRAYRSGPTVGAAIVNHPGFTAREFPKLIADEFEETYAGEMQDAINIAARS
jgi:hypothetical protein